MHFKIKTYLTIGHFVKIFDTDLPVVGNYLPIFGIILQKSGKNI